MAPMQKAFWVEIVLLLLVAALLTLAYFTKNVLWLAILLLTVAGALTITVALVEMNYKSQKDERDKQINERAWNKGYYVFWISFVLFCFTSGFWIEEDTVVLPKSLLTYAPAIGGWVLVMARAVSGLILYKCESAA
jgi:magnesium-transporting ATPase (P-type)